MVPLAIVVESAQAETRAPARRTYEVKKARTQEAQLEQIAKTVSLLHPGAELSSTGDGAAIFVREGEVIVARLVQASQPSPATAPRDQEPLFAP